MKHSIPLRSLRHMLLLTCAATAAGIAALNGANAESGVSEPAQTSRPSSSENDRPDRKWLDRISDRDRKLLEINLSFAPPEIREDITWHGAALDDAMKNWDGLHGKVVILQSWTSSSSAGRGIPSRLARIPEQLTKMNIDGVDDVVVIAIHTPEGAEKALQFFARREIPVPVMLDPSGGFLDRLGIFKRPSNVIIDRTGAARFAGIRLNSLPDAVAHILAEPFDGSTRASGLAEPSEDDGAVAPPPPSGSFPPIRGGVDNARDMRGQRAPDLYVDRWINDPPAGVENKVVLLDFWATWCGPCIASIPHMNELAQTFSTDVVVAGVSNENLQAFEAGMKRLEDAGRLQLSDFRYHVGVDPSQRMQEAFQITAIPHAVVISSDMIVRWQGHPRYLTPQLMQQIVDANRALTGQSTPAQTPDDAPENRPRIRQFLERWANQ